MRYTEDLPASSAKRGVDYVGPLLFILRKLAESETEKDLLETYPFRRRKRSGRPILLVSKTAWAAPPSIPPGWETVDHPGPDVNPAKASTSSR